MTGDMIEVCSKCGKMPRGIDLANGTFRCTRCGNSTLTSVTNDDYEKIVTGLDQKYHAEMSKRRLETVERITVPVITFGKGAAKTTPQKKGKPKTKKAVKKPAKKRKK